jgi:hypothetical protein
LILKRFYSPCQASKCPRSFALFSYPPSSRWRSTRLGPGTGAIHWEGSHAFGHIHRPVPISRTPTKEQRTSRLVSANSTDMPRLRRRIGIASNVRSVPRCVRRMILSIVFIACRNTKTLASFQQNGLNPRSSRRVAQARQRDYAPDGSPYCPPTDRAGASTHSHWRGAGIAAPSRTAHDRRERTSPIWVSSALDSVPSFGGRSSLSRPTHLNTHSATLRASTAQKSALLRPTDSGAVPDTNDAQSLERLDDVRGRLGAWTTQTEAERPGRADALQITDEP